MKARESVHAFYSLPALAKWATAIMMAAVMLTMVVYWTVPVYEFPFAYFTIVLITPFMQFLATPALTLLGAYRYLFANVAGVYPN